MQTATTSPQRLARLAGAFYLVNIVAGAFAIGYVPSAAPTIHANEALFRAGIAAHLIVTLTNPAILLIFYELFKSVSRRLALMAAFFGLVATAIEASSLALQAENSAVPAYDLYTAFFGFSILTIGYLVYMSGFLPRVIGALLLLDGAVYLVYAFTHLMAPTFASHLVPWSQLPILAGEGSLTIWLVVRGVNARRWSERLSDLRAPAPQV